MKALTLWQPWASAMAPGGPKRIETRSWSTKHRGLLAIHASVRAVDRRHVGYVSGRDYPLGAVLGLVNLLTISEMTREVIEAHRGTPSHTWGIWEVGRFAWTTDPVWWFDKPIPCPGRQGLFNLPPLVVANITIALRAAHDHMINNVRPLTSAYERVNEALYAMGEP